VVQGVKKLLRGVDVKVSVFTQAHFRADPATSFRTRHQCWSWEGGDAIVAFLNNGKTRVYISHDDDTYIVDEPSLDAAMRRIGLNPDDFTVYPDESAS
jgi:hypothetical protein